MAKLKLSVLAENLSGAAGNVVFAKGKEGTTVKRKTISPDPRSSAQVQARRNLTKAAGLFKALTPSQVAQWRAYAQTQERVDPTTGVAYHPSAISCFVGLLTKLYQMNVNVELPFLPPAAPFSGDSITVSVAAGAGKLTFTASAANSANVKTELLVQPLPSPNRLPYQPAMRSKAFQTFTSGVLTKDVTVPPGYYAAGYRFVNAQTGQETPIQILTVNQVTMALEQGGKNETKKAA